MCLLVLNWSGQACLLTCGHAQCSAVTGLQTLISWRAPSRRPWCQRSLFLWGQGSRCWLLAVFRTGRQEYWHLGEPATPIPATKFATHTACVCCRCGWQWSSHLLLSAWQVSDLLLHGLAGPTRCKLLPEWCLVAGQLWGLPLESARCLKRHEHAGPACVGCVVAFQPVKSFAEQRWPRESKSHQQRKIQREGPALPSAPTVLAIINPPQLMP